MNKYKLELVYSILDKNEEMVEWMGSKEGYSEEQRLVILDLDNFLKKEFKPFQKSKSPTKFVIPFVSCGQLSPARHHGGIDMNGKTFKYIYTLDLLVRQDLLREYRKFKKKTQPNAIRPNDSQFVI